MKLTLCWIMLLVGAQLCHGGDSTSARKTLAGITAVYVVVEELPFGAGVLGLSKQYLLSDVELELRSTGMQVVRNLEPYLYIDVNVSTDGRAANVIVELDQAVKLVRAPTNPLLTCTWSVEGVIANPSARSIRKAVKDFVDQFLTAWLSVNPKSAPFQN
jgi:hypothetical protein